MKETTKSQILRENRGDFEKFLHGNGIDIGAGDDILTIKNGTVVPWDIHNGNAQDMSGVNYETYDFVYSSHCLEHMVDIEETLFNWCRILKYGGILYLVIPDMYLYEKNIWPSKYNGDHKHTFSLDISKEKVNRVNHYHIEDIRKILRQYDIEILESYLEDKNFDYNRFDDDQTLTGALSQICIIGKKIVRNSGKILLKPHILLGDHICAEPTIRELCQKYRHVYISTRYPELFYDYPYNINLIKEEEESNHEWNIIYKLISDGNANLVTRVAELVGVNLRNILPRFNVLQSSMSMKLSQNKYIAISCESHYANREWDMEKWEILCCYFKKLKYEIIQLGKWGNSLKNVDKFYKNYSLTDISHLIKNSHIFITVDSGLSHLAASIQKEYIVLMHDIPVKNRQHYPYTKALFSDKGLNDIHVEDVINICKSCNYI